METSPASRGNLFASVPEAADAEFFETLASGFGPVRIERIVSRGHASPPDFWYDQEEAEWVALLSGSAVLKLDGPDGETIPLSPGDWIHLPAHRKHRVESTESGTDTVWLAVFFSE